MDFDYTYLKKGILRVINVHLLSIIISAFMTFVAPKWLSTYDYGLWQLYLLYVGYIGFFHFGWIDGIYLRLAGKHYDDLDKKELKSELYIFSIVQFIISVVIVLFGLYNKNIDKTFVIICVAISLTLVNVKFFLIYVMQATGRVKEFSNVAFIQSFLQALFFILYSLINKNYKTIILADVTANILSLILAIYYCQDICIKKYCILGDLKNGIMNTIKGEIRLNISAGSKLMIANILALLTTGVLRIGIEKKYGVEDFGKVSLALSFSALCINIFNSMGVVFIPLIKNKSVSISKILYENIHIAIDLVVFFFMIFYYPVKVIFSNFMPNYVESFEYLAITFPIMYFGCIQSLLQTTYLKAFRQEKNIFLSNAIILIFSALATFIGVRYGDKLVVMVVAIMLVYIIRNIIYEFYISKCINSNTFIKHTLQSIIVPVTFSICNYVIKGYKGLIIFAILYCAWVFINKQNILSIKNKLLEIK